MFTSFAPAFRLQKTHAIMNRCCLVDLALSEIMVQWKITLIKRESWGGRVPRMNILAKLSYFTNLDVPEIWGVPIPSFATFCGPRSCDVAIIRPIIIDFYLVFLHEMSTNDAVVPSGERNHNFPHVLGNTVHPSGGVLSTHLKRGNFFKIGKNWTIFSGKGENVPSV